LFEAQFSFIVSRKSVEGFGFRQIPLFETKETLMVMSMNGAASTNGSYISHSPLSNGTLDMDRVREQVREEDDGKWDATVFRDQLTLLNGKLLVPESVGSTMVEELTPTTWATAQMCGRLGIPTAYFRRCPTDLQDAQFNVWTRQHDRFESNGYDRDSSSSNGHSSSGNERWLLRAKHDSLRGVLSDRYTRLDNEPFLDCLEPLVPSRLQVKWFALTGESLHLRLIDPTLAREVLPDDRIMVGLHIANSEVGKRSVTVDAIVWRLICQNGLVRLVKGKSLLQQRHIFVSQSNFKRDLERAMGEALTTAAGLLEKMAQSTSEYLDDIETVIEKIGERHQLSEAFQEKVKNALKLENRGQQESLYGLTNALTQAAQTLPPDERYGLEVLAGEVMERGTLWLNGLPKAKTRRKVEPFAGNHGSSFVSAASISPIQSRGVIWDARPEAEVVADNGFAAIQAAIQASAGASCGELSGQAKSACVHPVSADVPPELPRVSSVPPKVPVQTVGSPEQSVRADQPASAGSISDKPDKPDKPASSAQKEIICALCSRRGLGTYDRHYLMQQEFDKSDLDALTQTEAKQLTIWLQQRPYNELLAPIPDYDEDEEMANEDE
jgi:hypothetical protein